MMNKVSKKAEKLLNDAVVISRAYGFDITTAWVLEHWSEKHRFWHTPEHLYEMLFGIKELIDDQKCNDIDYKLLVIAAIFHDIVYDTKRNDNEEKSVEMMLSTFNEQIVDYKISISAWRIKEDTEKIVHIILGTKTHENNDSLSKKFNRLDTMILDAQFIDMLDWEKKIYQEYKWVGWKKYKQGRIKFLLSQIKHHTMNAINLKNLIDYLKNKKPKTGIYFYDVDNLPSVGEFKTHLNNNNELFDIVYILFVYSSEYDKHFIKQYAKETDYEFLVMREKTAMEFISRQSDDVTLIRQLDLLDVKGKNFNQILKEKLKGLRIIFV